MCRTRLHSLETIKRQRLDSRLVGEFEWSLFQRAFDGVRLDATRSRWKATAIGFMPTQGGFARHAGTTITDIIVAGGTVSSRPKASRLPRTQVQGFGLYYRDRRPVTQRPDNTGKPAAAVDVDVTTFGGAVVGAYPAGSGEADVYSTMNLDDRFVQVLARPRPSLGLRLDVHRLSLASSADLWYGGSGATLGSGDVFGYSGRRSNGSRDLGTSVEISGDYTLLSRISVNAFLARISGGPVVTGTFAGDRLWYGYVESVITLGAR